MNRLFILISLFIISSCSGRPRNEAVENRPGAAEGLPSLAYTIYTDKTELFAEFRTLVEGDTMKLAGHFTRTGELFTALTDGTVTLSLMVDGNIVSQTSKVSSSPGIFRFAIAPARKGIGKMVFEIKNSDYTDQVIIDSVIVYPDVKTAMASATEEDHGSELSYLKEQAWKVEFANMAVTPQSFCEVIKTTGEILAASGDEMVVTANASGIVTFSSDKAVAGSSVGRGEVIFTISGGDLTDGNAETQYKKAKAAYDKAKADYDRAQELVKENIVSQKDFQDAKAIYETEQANYNNIAKNYLSGGQKVTAPLSGFVKNVLVTEGQYVAVGQPLATVSQNKRLVLRAEVSQKYFQKLGDISTANFRSAYDNRTYSIESLNGRLLSFGKSNDEGTPFIPVTFSFENKGGIVPGSLAEVFLKLKPYDGAMVIPVTALIEEQGIFFAYVQTAGESFVKRELALGGTDGINVQVLSGLRFGERVVTRGAYQIKLATASGVIPAHGHAH